MGSSAELANNNDLPNANIIWTAPNVEDVTIFTGSGTSTDTSKYLNKGSSGTGYSVIADQDIEVFSCKNSNDELYLGDARQVAINTRRTRALKHPTFTTLGIRILTANTIVQLEVF